jgi:hypothetical protein
MEEAAKEYERIVRSFTMGNSHVPSWMVRLWLPETRLGIRTLHAIAGLVQTSEIDNFMGNSMTHEEPQKLEYPDYFGLRPGRRGRVDRATEGP